MTTIQDVIAAVERLAGHPLNSDEGLHHGRAERAIERALVCWMATPDALAHAASLGAQLVIAHESLYYPYDAVVRTDNPPGWEDWPTNRQRRELLQRHDLGLLRVHGSADEICIYDAFARLFELGEPVAGHGLDRIYEIAPCRLDALIERVKIATGMASVRVAASQGIDQVVSRVGLPWGGLGLFVNVGYQQRLIALGCDVMIAGESDNYGFRFCQELGIPMIETSHEVSENPGLRLFAEMLTTEMGLPVSFYENPLAYRVI
jgi:putative NIF3 family GTP cyclohydrolase 1 type 2